MDKIIVKHTCIVIPNYNLGDCEDIERSLSIWNERTYKLEPKGYYYNEDRRELVLPRGLDLGYLEHKLKRPIELIKAHDSYAKAVYKLLVEPKNDIQTKSISFLIGGNDFEYTRKHSQQALNLDTGDGKTYCIIASLTFLQLTSMIITPKDNIKEQWKASYLDMTNIDEKTICDISGKKVIDYLLKSKKNEFKVYLVNHATLRSYAKKNGWDKITELFKKLEIGAKVYDEAHLEFQSMMKIDAHTNTKKTFYLTANFERSAHKENAVFSLAFKNIPKFGIETRDDKRKHIVYVAVFFNSKPKLDEKMKMMSRKGLDRYKYIDYQIEKEMIFDVIKYVVDYFSRKEGKFLILSSKKDSSLAIQQWLQETYRNKTVSLYNSDIPHEDKIIAKEADIISSTPPSFSTGTDIHGLRFNIMTEPYSSKVTANQVAGRLREYGETEYTFHVELIDKGFPHTVEMYKRRLKVFKTKCVSVNELKYN